MKTLTDKFKNKRSLIIKMTILSLITISIGIPNSCTNPEKEPYTIIKIKAKDGSRNFSKSLFGYILSSDSLHSTAMMVEGGDLLGIGKDGNPIYYTNTGEKEFTIKSNELFCYVNEKIQSIHISKDIDLLPWFKRMNPSDISGLQSLIISSPVPESYYPYLKEIAKTKPAIGLWFDEEPANKELLKIFKPFFLAGMNISQKDCNLFPNLKEVQLLVLSDSGSLVSSPLPYLPKLKQLIIPDADTWGKHTDLLDRNKQIERLTISGDIDDSLFLHSLNNLKELSIVTLKNTENKRNMNFLKRFKHLEVLSLVGGNYSGFDPVNELHHLRWLSLLTITTQHEFESIVEHHKDLEMFEFLSDSAKNLQPLLQFKNLYGLVIVNAAAVDPALLSMKKLKYLSISKDAMAKDSIRVAVLHKSLPTCTIVPNDGFCMGSGWLLLLLPLTLLFRICIRNHPRHSSII